MSGIPKRPAGGWKCPTCGRVAFSGMRPNYVRVRALGAKKMTLERHEKGARKTREIPGYSLVNETISGGEN